MGPSLTPDNGGSLTPHVSLSGRVKKGLSALKFGLLSGG